MYSPRIREDLIPLLYQIKQAQGNKPMTQIVDDILRPCVLKLHEQLVKYEVSKQSIFSEDEVIRSMMKSRQPEPLQLRLW